MSDLIDLRNVITAPDTAPSLAVIRLDGNEKPLIFFTSEGIKISRHYVEFPDLRGYLHCNDSECVICKIGNKPDTAFLIPTYDPLAKEVGVLPVSAAQSPHSLLPQLLAIWEMAEPVVVFISRTGSVYKVSASPMPESVDGGEALIQAFRVSLEAGEINLESVYEKHSNAALAMIPEVRDLLLLKGIATQDAGSVIGAAMESDKC